MTTSGLRRLDEQIPAFERRLKALPWSRKRATPQSKCTSQPIGGPDELNPNILGRGKPRDRSPARKLPAHRRARGAVDGPGHERGGKRNGKRVEPLGTVTAPEERSRQAWQRLMLLNSTGLRAIRVAAATYASSVHHQCPFRH